LADRLQEELENDPNYPKLTQQQVMGLMTGVFKHISDALAYGEDVYLEGFGRFYPDCKAPRKIKSGLTSQTHITKYKIFVKFNAFKQLNKRVQGFLRKLCLDETLLEEYDEKSETAASS
jgi:nucleoid DNA-binding protein